MSRGLKYTNDNMFNDVTDLIKEATCVVYEMVLLDPILRLVNHMVPNQCQAQSCVDVDTQPSIC